MTTTITESSYSKLLKHLKKEIAEGLDRAQKAYDREKVITYWNIGKSISEHLLINKNRADYGKKLYKKLSNDLGIGERLLYQMSQFYTTYPDFEPTKNLKWSHYRLLTSVKDEEKRNLLESKASDDNLSNRALEAFIKEVKEEPAKIKKPVRKRKLSLIRGRLYTYKIFKDKYADNLLIDCGFNIYKESDISQFRVDVVETVKTKNTFHFKASNATKKHFYTYKAYVQKIIDGDTIWLIIDCGFRVWIKQKIRLRGIDTPSMETKKGRESFKFVSNALKSLPFVIIKSHGRDKYDRYLIDVIYLKDEQNPLLVLKKGAFLNQVLLDEGLAVRQ